jgi:hypothetical protein
VTFCGNSGVSANTAMQTATNTSSDIDWYYARQYGLCGCGASRGGCGCGCGGARAYSNFTTTEA